MATLSELYKKYKPLVAQTGEAALSAAAPLVQVARAAARFEPVRNAVGTAARTGFNMFAAPQAAGDIKYPGESASARNARVTSDFNRQGREDLASKAGELAGNFAVLNPTVSAARYGTLLGQAQNGRDVASATGDFALNRFAGVKVPGMVSKLAPLPRLAISSGIRGLENDALYQGRNLVDTGKLDLDPAHNAEQLAIGAAGNAVASPLLTAKALRRPATMVKRAVEDVGNQGNIATAVRTLNANIPHEVVSTSQGRKGGRFDANVDQVRPVDTRELVLPEKEALRVLKDGGANPKVTVVRPYGSQDQGSQVTIHLDKKGKVVSWSPERPEFADRVVNSPYAPSSPYRKALKARQNIDQMPGGPLSMEGAQFRSEPDEAELKRVAGNLSQHNPGISQTEAEAIARDVIKSRGTATAKSGSQGLPLEETLVDNNPKFNVNRVNVSPEKKQVLSETIDANNALVSGAKGPKIKRTAVVERANQIAEESNGTIAADEILDYQARMLNTRQKLAKAVDDSGGKMTPELAAALKEDLSQSKFLASSLSNRAISADPSSKSSLVSFVKEISGHGTDLEEVIRRAEGVDFNDANQASAFYREFIKPKAGDWLDLLRYNSMLSSPNTQINNAFSNSIQVGLVKPAEKAIAGGIDFLSSSFTGKQRTAFAGEGAAYSAGTLKSLGNGARAFADVLLGDRLDNNLDTRFVPLATEGAKGMAHKVLSYPMTVMGAVDQFFQEVSQGGELAALKYRQGKGGTVPADLEASAASSAERTLFRRELGQKGDGTLANAIDYLPARLQEAKQHENPIIRNIAKWTLPFVKTPTNILKQGLEYSPAGVLNLPGNANKTEALAKASLGSAVFAGAATLLGAGRLTWGAPTSQKERDAFYASGRQPYAVKVGNSWVAYSKLGPLAFPIAMVAAVDDAEKNAKLDQSTAEQVIAGIAKYGEFFADQSYLKSMGDLLNSGQKGGIAKVVSNYPQQLVPYRAALGWLARLGDGLQRDPNAVDGSFIDKQVAQMMSQIPGLSEKVPARTDASGAPVPQQNQLLNAFSPLKVTTEDPAKSADYQAISQKNRNDSLSRQQVETMKQGGTAPSAPGTVKGASVGSLPSNVTVLPNGKYAVTDQAGEVKTYANPKAARLAGARDLVENGIEEQVDLGDRVVRTNPETGEVQVVVKAAIRKAAAEATYSLKLQEAKAAGDYASWEKLQKDRYLALAELNKTLDPVLDEPKVLKNQNAMEDILSQAQRYRGYGGAFKKPPKPKKVRAPRAVSVKTTMKSPSLKVTQPKAKSPKVRLAKVKIKRIKQP